MNDGAIDRETESLILELLSEDSHSLYRLTQISRRGHDFNFALRIQQEEIAARLTLLSDRAMCLSLDRATRSDGPQLQVALIEERDAMEDHIVACRLGGVEPPALIEAAPILISDFERLAIGAAPEIEVGNEEKQIVLYQRIACAACQEYGEPDNLATVACGDVYCRDCLETVFQAAIADEERFPPRCCGQPILITAEFLAPDVIHQYEQKKLEYETLDRTYCSSSKCEIFLKPENIKDDCGTCPACATRTCKICKAIWHTGDCPADAGLRFLLETAQVQGWKRCMCGRMVELIYGCNHISCPCGRHFCYECSALWRTCRCILFTEGRLLGLANARVARGAPVPGVALEQQVAEAREVIIEQHACTHMRWVRDRNGGTCDECDSYMERFILTCAACGQNRCARCRRDR